MSKRVSAADRVNKDKKESASDILFKPTQETEIKDEKKSASTDLKRQTYYVTQEIVDALLMYKAFENKDISVIAREALYAYIPEEYLKRAREKHK